MDAMGLDVILASLHHLAAFSLVGLLAVEAALLFRPDKSVPVARMARIDLYFGLAALLLLVIGVLRVIYGIKGSAFYVQNPVFWTKMVLFGTVGIISIWPTVQYLRWQSKLRRDTGFWPDAAAFRWVRLALVAEIAFTVAIPVTAAMMARGIGL
ncbi:DUF2214 family protein [Gloeobacter kilaueensis]|uniref:DUF2214 family protein n=1 Tax=Gloeobacter kilaueensis (strain ATCC BAA-2537 / CCAP 1431/1 / ULC 316 / JS1) TaxID=1183438 RepID=U5QQZ8_GLOK1|nr:DUF2214 family protein [Gloeobacter kilaueensis]AGY60140.1 hypothetical protein GKIL_3894 [Gloeobacter kilaueensis JS1]